MMMNKLIQYTFYYLLATSWATSLFAGESHMDANDTENNSITRYEVND